MEVKKIKKNKVLLIHRFYHPDSPPYASILNDMRDLLLEEGFIVDILSSQPSYKRLDKEVSMNYIEKTKNSTIYRLPVFKLKNHNIEKILNFFWFPFCVFFFLLFHRKYNIVSVSTAPQVLLAFSVAVVVRLRKSKLLYHCMDIYPEIGSLSGEFRNKYIFKILLWMDNFTCRIASKIIVLSEDMKKSLLLRSSKIVDNIEIINNYNLSSEVLLKDNFFEKDKSIRRVVFSGNIGKFQNLKNFIFALKNNKPLTNFELVFLGEGNALNELKDLANSLDNVKFIPHQPISIARKIISEADMGIVSLQENVIHYAYPSKTMTYLAEGTAILVSVDSNSEIVKFVHESDIGIAISNKNTFEIYDIFKKLSLSQLNFDREHIKKVFNENLSKEQFDKKIIRLFNNLKEKR